MNLLNYGSLHHDPSAWYDRLSFADLIVFIPRCMPSVHGHFVPSVRQTIENPVGATTNSTTPPRTIYLLWPDGDSTVGRRPLPQRTLAKKGLKLGKQALTTVIDDSAAVHNDGVIYVPWEPCKFDDQ